MKLTVLLVCHDMARELPRTLQSLSRDYQEGARELDYEVLLVDNGSPVPPDPASWEDIDVPVRLIRVEHATASPTPAINLGLAQARGEIICYMCDAAHLLTPGVFNIALAAYRGFDNPVVAIRYFYLGPDEQTISVSQGYDKQAEDELLERIDWPDDGYRLFEIGTPLRQGAMLVAWLNRIGETNCLFLRRSLFEELGGADERFDLPGGGFVNMDIYKRAAEAPGATLLQIIGEGSFHQLHGGITTNSQGGERDDTLESYRRNYREIRGSDDLIADVPIYHMGHMRTPASNITARERRKARAAGKLPD
ncbi:MAG: glycosyltransferase [Halioglobus sp.]|nr:glycosyltransferase [Halioglobus sp.]